MTVLGGFPLMNFDMRAATSHLLFGRVDLDPFNSLRFGFSVETHAGEDVLIFRNGGQFMGLDRDTRTRLVASYTEGGTYHFYAIEKGCDYIDATFTFVDADELNLFVSVKGSPHLLWKPLREESRELPDPFPADESSQGGPTTPFPTMPSLRANFPCWALQELPFLAAPPPSPERMTAILFEGGERSRACTLCTMRRLLFAWATPFAIAACSAGSTSPTPAPRGPDKDVVVGALASY